MQIQTTMSTARHQQTNGQAEHAVKMAKTCLRAYADYKGKNWIKMSPLIEYALNNSVSSATGFSPFVLAYGLNPGKVLPTIDKDLQSEIQERIQVAQLKLARQQDQMESQANTNRSAPEPILPGQRVLLKRDGITWPADSQTDAKLLSKYLGPFTLKSQDTNGNYELELPNNLKIHNKFAPDVIKKYYEPNEHFPEREVLHPIKEECDPATEYEVEKILDHRLWGNQKQFLIRWKGFGQIHDSWEPAEGGTSEEQNIIMLLLRVLEIRLLWSLAQKVITLMAVQSLTKTWPLADHEDT